MSDIPVGRNGTPPYPPPVAPSQDPVIPAGKHWYQSKTVWANLVAVAAGVAGNIFGLPISGDTGVAVLGGVNILLRLFTSTGLLQ